MGMDSVYMRITYTLVKFSKPSSSHGWIVPTVYLSYVIPFHLLDLVHCQVASKRDLVKQNTYIINLINSMCMLTYCNCTFIYFTVKS